MDKIERACSFCHIVIPALDLSKAKQFYEKIFRWTVTENHPGPAYWFFESGNVGGAFDGSAQPSRGSIVLVIEVEDMPATIQNIIELGGTIVQDRSRIGDAAAGYDAYFLDPSGNKLGIHSLD